MILGLFLEPQLKAIGVSGSARFDRQGLGLGTQWFGGSYF